MIRNTAIDLPVKPRVLIADDSRIVRATLIKQIEGIFEFKEALDGEEAWEILLLDPGIRVVITDLTMPKLDGYGLLRRIRGSKVARIRNIPVIVVSGSDEQQERDRAKAAGATDLITKGIETAQLLSRLDILSKLVSTQSEFERGLEVLVQQPHTFSSSQLSSPAAFDSEAGGILAGAVRHGRNFVLLHVCVRLLRSGEDGGIALPPTEIVHAIGQLLHRTIRQTDRVALTGEAEFTLVTGSINFDAARNFAQRVCGAIANANLARDSRVSCLASCGMISLSECGTDAGSMALPLEDLRVIARRRAALGLDQGVSGVVGAEEEQVYREGSAVAGIQYRPETIETPTPSLATILQWIKEGKKDLAILHIEKISAELQPLLDLVRQQSAEK